MLKVRDTSVWAAFISRYLLITGRGRREGDFLGGCVSPGTSLCSHGESPTGSVCEEEGPVQLPNPPLVSPWSVGAPKWGRAGSCPS